MGILRNKSGVALKNSHDLVEGLVLLSVVIMTQNNLEPYSSYEGNSTTGCDELLRKLRVQSLGL